MPLAKRTVRRVARSLGITPYNWMTLKMVRRPEWLYRGPRAIPRGRLEFRGPRPVTEDNVALCRRLIDAYVRATDAQTGAPATTGIWAWTPKRAPGTALPRARGR